MVRTLGIDLGFDRVNWFSIYKLHHRGVDHFSQEKVFLAGDSAHIHSPAGGQGMNTGLQDAYNLAWKLAFVLRNHAREELLDTYNEERLPFARWLLKFTDRGFNMMTSSNWFFKIFRKYVVLKIAGYALAISRIMPFIFRIVSQTGYSYKGSGLSKSFTRQNLKFKVGDRLPYFERSKGEIKFYEQFREPSFHLLHVGPNALDAKAHLKIDTLFPFPIKVVEDRISEKWKDLGVRRELFILVRPDNYVCCVFDILDHSGVKNHVENYFG